MHFTKCKLTITFLIIKNRNSLPNAHESKEKYNKNQIEIDTENTFKLFYKEKTKS